VSNATNQLLAIVSKNTYSCCMFESPIDLTEIRSALTDAGHTVVGFATLALKKSNEVRLDVTKKYEAQISDLRSQALTLAERAGETVSEIEDRVEPIVNRVTDRLPAPAASVARTLQSQGKALRHKAHEAVVEALTVDAPVAKVPAKVTAAAKVTAKSAAAPTTKPAAKTSVKTPVKTAAKTPVRTSKTLAKTSAKAIKSPAKPTKTAKQVQAVRKAVTKPNAKSAK
jgi:hypothetical protein